MRLSAADRKDEHFARRKPGGVACSAKIRRAVRVADREMREYFLDGGLFLGGGERPANAKTI